jgi:hypothetical protein
VDILCGVGEKNKGLCIRIIMVEKLREIMNFNKI